MKKALVLMGVVAVWGLAGAEPRHQDCDSDAIDAMIKNACTDGTRKIVIGKKPDGTAWLLDRAVVVPGAFTVEVDGTTLKLSDACRDNFFRSANAGVGKSGDEPLRNIRILGRNGATLEGAARPRATGDSGKALTNPYLVEDTKDWRRSFGTDAGRAGAAPKGDWRNIGVLFASVDGFAVEGFTVRESHCWALSFENCAHGVIRDITFDSCGTREIDGRRQTVRNQDGIDLRNGCHDIEISNIRGGTGDDVIALTAIAPALDPTVAKPCVHTVSIEGGAFGRTHVMHGDFSRRERDIYNVTISNVHATSWGRCAVVRLLPAECDIHHVTLTDIVETGTKGRAAGHTLLLGDADKSYGRNLPGSMRDITVRGVVSSNALCCVAVKGYLKDSELTGIVNHNPAAKTLFVTRTNGLENVTLDKPQ